MSVPSFPTAVPMMLYLEREELQSGGQPWKGLISGSSLGDDGKLGSWSSDITARNLDTIDIGILVGERGRSGDSCSQASSVDRLSAALPTDGKLRGSSNRRPGDHCWQRDVWFEPLRDAD
jgi:hypothetical protein